MSNHRPDYPPHIVKNTTVVTPLPVPAAETRSADQINKELTDNLLEHAKGKLTRALVVGYNEHGQIYTDTNILDGGDVLWLLEGVKKRLMEAVQFTSSPTVPPQ
jgi:hypothetical protein